MLQPVFTVWQQHLGQSEAPIAPQADLAAAKHPSPSLRDMHMVIQAKHLCVRIDGARGWSPTWSQPNTTSPSRPGSTTSVSFGTFGSQPPPPSLPVSATPPRTQLPFGMLGPSASPSTNNWSLPHEAPSSPSVTQPWATPPRVGSSASRSRSGSVKGRACRHRMHSRWDQATPRDVGPSQDWSTSVKTPTWFPHLALAQQPAA